MKRQILAVAAAALLGACATTPGQRDYGKPEVLVPPSNFKGVHGLAIDAKGRLLAGSVTGSALYEVDAATGKATVMIPPPEGQADDIAIGPRGEMAWTGFLQGVLRYRESDASPIRVLARDLPGINSVAFDRRNGRLYATQVFLGDALWEIDVAGARAPRLIARDLGGLNGFEVGRDGWIYGPLWFKGQVVRVNPDNGEVQNIARDFATPAAVNFDSGGNLYVVDTRTGELVRVQPGGARATVARLQPSLDNLAIDGTDRVFVSNMANNSIEVYNPADNSVRTITRGEVAVPGGLSLSADGKTLYVADVFALRAVDTGSGKVSDIHRMQASDMEYPFDVSSGSRYHLLTSWFTSTLQVLDRRSNKTVAMLHGLKAPSAALEMADGSLLVAEMGTGTITRLSGNGFSERAVVVKDLTGPVALAAARDGKLYLTEAAGRLSRINPSDWSRTTVAEGLLLPEGVAEAPGGRLIVAETAAARLTEIDPASGKRRVIADGLPIGFEAAPGMPPSNIPTGVAVDERGNIYFSADRNNAIYRIAAR